MRQLLMFSCLVFFLSFMTTAHAEETAGRWGIGLEGGMMKLVEGDWDYSNTDHFLGIRACRGLSRHWTLDLAFKYGYTRPGVALRDQSAGWTFDSLGPFATEMFRPSANLTLNIAPDNPLSPFLAVGAGVTNWRCMSTIDNSARWFPNGRTALGYDVDGNQVQLTGSDLTVTLAAGFDIRIAEDIILNLGSRYHILPNNKLDNVGWSHVWGEEYVDANKGIAEGYIGLTIWLGSLDKDNDGIKNKFDACPEEPEDFDGFEDEDGCPEPDNDQDGVPDAVDQCPLEPEDRDGFEDEDGCPEPDNDGDGIIDGQDMCPEEAEDFDGFEDADGCPEADNDGDGVLDGDDLCPGTPEGIEIDETGCPVIEEIKEELVLEGVTFLSGSAQLTPESVAVIARIAESLMAWPEVRIEVRGHTDSAGSAETNRDLSQRRAMAVRDSLVQIGIAPSRITAVGYGEDYPIADNSTREGRARNRRVELHRIE